MASRADPGFAGPRSCAHKGCAAQQPWGRDVAGCKVRLRSSSWCSCSGQCQPSASHHTKTPTQQQPTILQRCRTAQPTQLPPHPGFLCMKFYCLAQSVPCRLSIVSSGAQLVPRCAHSGCLNASQLPCAVHAVASPLRPQFSTTPRVTVHGCQGFWSMC
jgi:hypothetical protein